MPKWAGSGLAFLQGEARFALSVLNFYLNGLLPQIWPRLYWSLRYRQVDPWAYETSEYETRKYAATLHCLPSHQYRRALEVGCAEGVFTQRLAAWGQADSVLGVDVAEVAVERAQERLRPASQVVIRSANILQVDGLGEFDLIFCAETLSHMGSYRRLVKMKDRLLSLLEPQGYLVLVDSWPMGRLLHHPFKKDPRFSVLSERLEPDAQRPYVIRLLQRRNECQQNPRA
ncbi:methyltransferase domain-containing protein [bacterium]|nr:methyltransferase domain-containing protein [bacterium]